MPKPTNNQPEKSNSFWNSMSGELRGIIITSIVLVRGNLIRCWRNWTRGIVGDTELY